MGRFTDTERHCAELREACWMLRHYRRPIQRAQRAQAVLRLGLTVREAFSASDDFEPLLIALVEGLKPEEYRPPF